MRNIYILLLLITINLFGGQWSTWEQAPNYCPVGTKLEFKKELPNIWQRKNDNINEGYAIKDGVSYYVGYESSTNPDSFSTAPQNPTYDNNGVMNWYSVIFLHQVTLWNDASNTVEYLLDYYEFNCIPIPEFLCDDGAYSLNHTCDRECEDVGTYTEYVTKDYNQDGSMNTYDPAIRKCKTTPTLECQDGAPALDNSCDRECEDVGYTTNIINYYLDSEGKPQFYIPPLKTCQNEGDKTDLNTLEDQVRECMQMCGGEEFVDAEKSSVNAITNTVTCICKDQVTPPDPEPDPEPPADEVPDPENPNIDLTETNNKLNDTNYKLDRANDKLDKVNTNLDNIKSKQDTTNNLLSSIDSSSNTDNHLNQLRNNKLDTLNNTVSNGLDDVNSNLNDIKNINQGISDTLNDMNNNEDDSEPTDFQDDVGDNLGLLDNIANEYSTFKDNLISQYEAIINQGDEATNTINNGFTSIFSGYTSAKTSCNKSFTFNYLSNKSTTINFDVCEVTSDLNSITYPLFFIVFSIATFSFAFILFRGVL